MPTIKVLDEQGIIHLWKKISLGDYPNNETLVAVLNAIDETKADVTYVDEKIAALTPEENGQLTIDALTLADAITGDKYVLRIENGRLVSVPIIE